jgi:AraC-like DNA-binding protein
MPYGARAASMPPRAAPPGHERRVVAGDDAAGFLQGARRAALPWDAMLLRQGIAPQLLGSSAARIPLPAFAKLLRCVAWRMRDELVGLAGRPVPPGTLARVLHQMHRCATLGEALQTGLASYHIALPELKPSLRRDAGLGRHAAYVQVSGPPEAPRTFLHAAFLYWMLGVASHLVQQRIPVLEVKLRLDGESGLPHRRPIFGVPASLHSSAHSSLAFDASWLQRPVVLDEGGLRQLLSAAPVGLLVPFGESPSVAEQVRHRLRGQADGRMPSLEQTAWGMRMTPDMLRRRLAEEGSSFRAVKNELRRDLAVEMLARTSIKIESIAATLGFSESATFHRSFKAWTGLAPGEYRRLKRPAWTVAPPGAQ